MAEVATITVKINGNSQQIAATSSLAQVLQQCADYQPWTAVAVNQQFIPKTLYPATTLFPDDCIEILGPMQGG